jgi:hypothetical protein
LRYDEWGIGRSVERSDGSFYYEMVKQPFQCHPEQIESYPRPNPYDPRQKA